MSSPEHEKQESHSQPAQLQSQGPEGASLQPPPFNLDSSSPLQMKSSPSEGGGEEGNENGGDLDAGSGKVRAQSGSSGGLSPLMQAKLEGALGENFSEVQLKTNSQEAVQLKADAFARKNEVHFAPGQFNPDSPQGQELIGHEFSHIKAQRKENIQANKTVNGQAVHVDPQHEASADADGKKVASFKLGANSSPSQGGSSSGGGGGAIQMKPSLPGLMQNVQEGSAEAPAQLMPTLPSVVFGALSDGENQEHRAICMAYEALSMVLDPELNHESDRESITSPVSYHHPNYYEGSGISLMHWYACWDFYKARWESSSSTERRQWVNRGIDKIRDLILPRALNIFERERRPEINGLIRSEIREQYQAVSRQRGSLVLRSIPETQEQVTASSSSGPSTASGGGSSTSSPRPAPRRSRPASRTPEQQATDQAFQNAADELIDARTEDTDEANYRMIDEANSQTESGRRYQASRLGTSAGQPASLGRGQLLTRLQVGRAIGYFDNNPRIAELIQNESGLTRDDLVEIQQMGNTTMSWYNDVTSSDGESARATAIRQLLGEGHPEQVLENYGDDFQAQTHLPLSDLQQMLDWQPFRSGGQRGELQSLRTSLSRQLTRLRNQRAMNRFRQLRRRPISMSDRDATLAVLTELSGGDSGVEEGTPVPASSGLEEVINYIRDHSDRTLFNSAGGSFLNQMLVDLYGDTHPNIRRLLAGHEGDRNQLGATDIFKYMRRPINAEDMNGWFTRGAMQSGHWEAFEELLPSLDIYSTQDRSLDNFNRALTVAPNIEGFEDLEGHSRNIFLGQMARMNHGGSGRFDAMYLGDESEESFAARQEAWESAQEDMSSREQQRYRRRHRRPRRRVRRRGGMRLFSGMAECRSVADVRRFYRQIFDTRNSDLAAKIRDSLTNWTRNYLSVNGVSMAETDIFIPLEGARDLLPPPSEEAPAEAEAAETDTADE